MRIENYELLKTLAKDDERETFQAVDINTAKPVFFHALRISANTDDPSDFSNLLKTLMRSGRGGELLFAGERDGKLCIVTEPVQECYDVRRWLEEGTGTAPTARPVPPPVAQPTLVETPPPRPQPVADVGEFTRMFQAPPTKLPPVPDAVPPKEPPQAPLPPAPPRSDPGEFTRMFQVAPPRVPETKMPPAQAPLPEPPLVAPSSPVKKASEFTGIFSMPAPQVEPTAPPPVPPAEPPTIPVTAKAEPGEFTRIMMARPKPAEPATPPTEPQKPQNSPPRPSYLPVVLILGGLFLAAVALILFFVLRR